MRLATLSILLTTLLGCTTINVTTDGDVIINANKNVNTEAGL